eukprot:362590-Chlamydomonas_euryale.AAC.2
MARRRPGAASGGAPPAPQSRARRPAASSVRGTARCQNDGRAAPARGPAPAAARRRRVGLQPGKHISSGPRTCGGAAAQGR